MRLRASSRRPCRCRRRRGWRCPGPGCWSGWSRRRCWLPARRSGSRRRCTAPPLHWFSFSLISSSRRKTIFFWMSWVILPPRDWPSRRSLLSISRLMFARSFSSFFQFAMSRNMIVAEHLVAVRGVGHVVDQADDRPHGVVLLDQGVLGHGPVEEVGGRVDRLLGLDVAEGRQRLLVHAAVGQRRGRTRGPGWRGGRCRAFSSFRMAGTSFGASVGGVAGRRP